MNAPICFIDTETNGLHPDRRPWEVAVIRRDHIGTTELGWPVTEEKTLLLQVRDFDLSNADPMALKIGGFYERHQQYGGRRPALIGMDPKLSLRENAESVRIDRLAAGILVDEETLAHEVEQLTRGAIVVGANVGFDTETLAPLLRRHRLIPSWHYRPVCIEAVVYGFLLGRAAGIGAVPPEIPLPWKSDHLGELLGVEPAAPEERHTALGDARWVQRMWDRINGGTR